MRSWMIVMAGAVCMYTSVQAGAVIRYTVTDLTTQAGIEWATAINNHGQVVGQRAIGGVDQHGDPLYQAVLWSNGAATDLNVLQTGSSVAWGINDAGQVVGQVSVDGLPSKGFLWSSGTVRTFESGSSAMAINASGKAVGAGSVEAMQVPRSWHDEQGSDLDTLGSGGGAASDINDAGQIVGELMAADGANHAVLWGPDAVHDLNDMSDLPGNWVLESASGINANGQVVGMAGLPDYVGHAFIWENGAVRDLGTLARSSGATAINNAGQVVGWTGGDNSWPTSHGFLWEDGTMYDLNDLVSLPDGWWLGSACAINDTGQILVETYGDGLVHAALLTPVPEPGTIVILLSGLSLIVMRRVRNA